VQAINSDDFNARMTVVVVGCERDSFSFASEQSLYFAKDRQD
jgi:hypothetical protein